jgi:hypothetical protein
MLIKILPLNLTTYQAWTDLLNFLFRYAAAGLLLPLLTVVVQLPALQLLPVVRNLNKFSSTKSIVLIHN